MRFALERPSGTGPSLNVELKTWEATYRVIDADGTKRRVTFNRAGIVCTCPDHTYKRVECVHIAAVVHFLYDTDQVPR